MGDTYFFCILGLMSSLLGFVSFCLIKGKGLGKDINLRWYYIQQRFAVSIYSKVYRNRLLGVTETLLYMGASKGIC